MRTNDLNITAVNEVVKRACLADVRNRRRRVRMGLRRLNQAVVASSADVWRLRDAATRLMGHPDGQELALLMDVIEGNVG
jgi:hypothetical protein